MGISRMKSRSWAKAPTLLLWGLFGLGFAGMGLTSCSSSTPGTGSQACATNSACTGDLVCITGVCVEATLCDEDADCGSLEGCVDGVCSQDGATCVDDAGCAKGLVCDDGACTAKKCADNDTCENGTVCIDGLCTVGTVCKESDDCADQMMCENGYCSAIGVACEDDTACLGALVCDEDSQTCIVPPSGTLPTDPTDPDKNDPTTPQPNGTQEYTESCDTTADCKGSLECFEHVCTKRCTDNPGCEDPNADLLMECVRYTTGGETTHICMPRSQKYCQSCANPGTTDNCGTEGQDLCIEPDDDGQPYCAIDCSDGKSCPEGSSCQDESLYGQMYRLCIPDAGVCTGCFDKDGDGYGDPRYDTSECPNGPEPDCDDTNKAIHPNAQTQCDGIDNACQGRADYHYTNEDGLYTTLEHCGACNNDCSALAHVLASATECSIVEDPSDASRQIAACVILECEDGWADCDGDPQTGCEVDLSDPLSCGQCGVSCGTTHTTTSTCALQSEEDEDKIYACEIECEEGYAHCSDSTADGCEVDLTSDKNCGSCGNDCTDGRFANAQGMCEVSGGTPECVMKPNSCDEGYADCDDDGKTGCETDLTSADNCGACGVICGDTNARSSICVAGNSASENTCVIDCQDGFDSCDGLDSTGCETDIRNSVDHCGTCGTSCAFAHTLTTCEPNGHSGICVFLGCEDDYADCGTGGMPSNINQPFIPTSFTTGCADYLIDNDQHCGTCSNDCTAIGDSICMNAECKYNNCPTGLLDCDDDGSCGYDRNDPATCGGCATDCTAVYSLHVDDVSCNPDAADKRCKIEACDTGYANCDGDFSTGCETNTLSDINHCGACQHKCELPHATTACTNGGCGFVSCDAGYLNLEGNEDEVGCPYACTPTTTIGGDRPEDLSDPNYDPERADSNCDGIDGDVNKALFVDVYTGNDNFDGSIQAPLKTMGEAFSRLRNVSSSIDQIYVSRGEYNESIELVKNVGIYGGFDAARGWQRSAGYEVIIKGGERSSRTENNTVAVYGKDLTKPQLTQADYQGTVIQNVTIQANNASGTTTDGLTGATSYGIWCDNCGSLRVLGTIVKAGAGTNGKQGTQAGKQDYESANGLPSSCKGSPGDRSDHGSKPGGPGGIGFYCPIANVTTYGGGAGGGSEQKTDGHNGNSGLAPSGRTGGAGGAAGIYSSGNGTAGQTLSPVPGDHGAAGIATGALTSTNFWKGNAGKQGAAGQVGYGGGGGGGGAGGSVKTGSRRGGGSGGGGGAGGCPGTGGDGGAAGGASIGIALLNSDGAITQNTRIHTSTPGTGGAGRKGGNEGVSCAGGNGKEGYKNGGNGGNGGSGQKGGAGGAGGGGAGGASIGVLLHNTNTTPSSMTYELQVGGIGGASEGNEGKNGTKTELLSL